MSFGNYDQRPDGVVLTVLMLVPAVFLAIVSSASSYRSGFSGSSALSPNIPYLNSIGWLVPVVMSYFPSRPEGVKYDNPNGSQPASI